MKYKSIAVDGPSGAGKSTLARMLAHALGFLYVDTGAIYRTVGLYALRHGVDPEDVGAVQSALSQITVDLGYGEDGFQHMYLNGEDVTEEIRSPEVSRCASAISGIPEVRTFLLQMQRSLAARQNVIMDGRDIGTVVLPDADVKIFLTASSEARAGRRHAELVGRGEHYDLNTVLAELVERDRRDTTREAAPLRQAEDAILVDTTHLSLEQSLQALLENVKEQIGT